MNQRSHVFGGDVKAPLGEATQKVILFEIQRGRIGRLWREESAELQRLGFDG